MTYKIHKNTATKDLENIKAATLPYTLMFFN